ncbi:uncharacterized protein LOC124371875 [Homalodisca vitripennis]|uniref:uncharacterized protein LOC124371875 n=1 Tax=Homalodisca vitripennis TaxID=197043 RepID=UPI001EE9CE25|nr:uncharacterized protein LOC124371875 [Homalodisca vitripennis]
MLTISCRDLQLCYQIKKTVLKRLENSEAKNISENLVLDIQALYQSFEIESLRENPNIQSLEVVRQKLRNYDIITPANMRKRCEYKIWQQVCMIQTPSMYITVGFLILSVPRSCYSSLVISRQC